MGNQIARSKPNPFHTSPRRIKKMKIEMQSGIDSSFFSFSSWNNAIIGKPVDDRGMAAVKFTKENSEKVFSFTLNHKELTPR